MGRYRLAHLGLGGRGREYIRPFQESDRYDLVGICDMDAERLVSAAQGFSIAEDQCYSDCAEMLDACRPDVFSFVTLAEIRQLWPRLERYLGRSRRFWVWLLDCMGKHHDGG